MEHGFNIAILVTLLVQLGIIVGLVAVITSKVRAMNDQVVSFVSPVSDEVGSPLSTLVETTSDMFARAIMARAKMTFAGLTSGVVRGEAAVTADISEDVARMNPVVDGILNSFPALKKTLRKNPALFDFAIGKLVERFAGPGAGVFGVGGAPGNGVQPEMPPGRSKINS